LRTATTPPAFLQQVLQRGLDLRSDAATSSQVHPPAAGAHRHGYQPVAVLQQQRTYWAQVSRRSRRSTGGDQRRSQTKIVDPLQAGQTLFDTHAYLTRLATFISRG
jgi:hypothetical protein